MSDLSNWSPRPWPGSEPIEGRTVTVEPIVDERRFGELYEAFSRDEPEMWRWLAYGPFESEAQFRDFAARTYLAGDQMFHAVIPHDTGHAAGVASLMRIDRANGVVEIGNIALSRGLRGSRASTEMQYLMMGRVFDELGYRRYEWKCNDRNEPSKRTARRLGFRYEGLFRQHMIVKGENRDTAWFSVLDAEWPALKAAFEAWLDPSNFDADGRQKRPLETFREG